MSGTVIAGYAHPYCSGRTELETAVEILPITFDKGKTFSFRKIGVTAS